MRIWTYKNADEKAHTFSRRSKNVKKRTKTYEKRILCKFTLTVYLVRIWTYKNADEKAHTFSRRSKNVKKRTKKYEKRILCNRGGVEDTRLEAKAKDSLSEDRHSRGQGQECLRPRPRTKDTSASALQKKKKKVFTKIFQAISTKKRFLNNFSSAPQNFNNSKILLSSSRGQANFRGLEASRPRPRTSKSVLEDSTSAVYIHLYSL